MEENIIELIREKGPLTGSEILENTGVMVSSSGGLARFLADFSFAPSERDT